MKLIFQINSKYLFVCKYISNYMCGIITLENYGILWNSDLTDCPVFNLQSYSQASSGKD